MPAARRFIHRLSLLKLAWIESCHSIVENHLGGRLVDGRSYLYVGVDTYTLAVFADADSSSSYLLSQVNIFPVPKID